MIAVAVKVARVLYDEPGVIGLEIAKNELTDTHRLPGDQLYSIAFIRGAADGKIVAWDPWPLPAIEEAP